MTGKTIKTSQRMNMTPGYYKRIIDRLQPIRDDLLNAAEAKGDTHAHHSESEERRQADKLTAKIQWAIIKNGVQSRMIADAEK